MASKTEIAHTKPLTTEHTNETEKPMSPNVWRFMLIIGVVMYGSFSVLVHLTEVGGKIPFSSASLFLIVEFAKLSISLTLLFPEMRQKGIAVLPRIKVVLPYSIPALLYLITNNLGIHMQTEMDPATYQILCNMKIISTALLYRLIIKKPISVMQWYSIGLLAFAGGLNSYGGINVNVSVESLSSGVVHITTKGLVMITIYCILSGLAGVYNEYILKEKYEMSIHIQNTMLYSFGCLFNGSAFLLNSANSINSGYANPTLPCTNSLVYFHFSDFNLLRGFTFITWILVACQASVGLIMSSVIKHGSNITRLYFISCAMVVTTMLSMAIFGLQLNIYFATSFVIVVIALYLNYK